MKWNSISWTAYHSIKKLLPTQYSLLYILHAVMVFIKDVNCPLQVQVLRASHAPRQWRQPVQVVPSHTRKFKKYSQVTTDGRWLCEMSKSIHITYHCNLRTYRLVWTEDRRCFTWTKSLTLQSIMQWIYDNNGAYFCRVDMKCSLSP
jgi:hypothetical protein